MSCSMRWVLPQTGNTCAHTRQDEHATAATAATATAATRRRHRRRRFDGACLARVHGVVAVKLKGVRVVWNRAFVDHRLPAVLAVVLQPLELMQALV